MKKPIRLILTFILLCYPSFAIAEDLTLEPESWSYPAVIEHARKISPNNVEGKPFNEFGLVYPIDELESIRVSELDAQELQKYADIVTHAYPDAVAKQMPESLDRITLQKINNTAIAGLAYISIHAKGAEAREHAKRLLSEILEIAPADDTINPQLNYESMRNVHDESQFVQRIWGGDGIVLVGKLEIPTDARISTRIPIYKDGSYCTALYRGRKLVFFAHGYDPLEITHYSPIATNVYDAGLHRFVRASPEDTRTLRGTLATKSTNGQFARIDCTLQLRNHAYLWQDHGNRCGAPITINVGSTSVESGMPFIFNNLSRLPYVLVLTAPGYIKQEIEIDRELNDVIDLGEISLSPALSYRIKYRARVRQDGGEWIGDSALQTSAISCDGNSEFMFTNQRDGLGNSLKLRMRPNKEGVVASFFYRKRNSPLRSWAGLRQ